MEQVIGAAQAEQEAYYYRNHAGAELDLLIVRGNERYGFEFKFEDALRPTRSMYIAKDDLKLTQLWVVFCGERALPLADGISTLPLSEIHTAIARVNS